MINKMENILTELWNRYKSNGKSVVLNPYAFFMEQKIFIKLDQIGEISELERTFLIDYMQSGIMDEAEILDYEDLRIKYPDAMLPEIDFSLPVIEYAKELNIEKEKFMFLPLNQHIFKTMFEIKSNSLEPILKQYDVDRKNLYDLLWKEFDIPGMEIRIANTAFDFLIDCCENKRELEKTLKSEIKKNILMSSIFYTNVAPDAINTMDFNS